MPLPLPRAAARFFPVLVLSRAARLCRLGWQPSRCTGIFGKCPNTESSNKGDERTPLCECRRHTALHMVPASAHLPHGHNRITLVATLRARPAQQQTGTRHDTQLGQHRGSAHKRVHPWTVAQRPNHPPHMRRNRSERTPLCECLMLHPSAAVLPCSSAKAGTFAIAPPLPNAMPKF